MSFGLNPFDGTVEGYYRQQARIYDRTRWSFLFGRTALIDVAARHCHPRRVLEVGCGTGHNLTYLRRLFPAAELHGVDRSADMLDIARHKLGGMACLRQMAYDKPLDTERGFDLIVAAYSLSMFNPGWEQAIAAMHADLSPGGCLALVDFHGAGDTWFARWMALHHVRIGEHLLRRLDASLTPVESSICRAYGGLWQYCLYLGRKPTSV